MNHKKIHKVTQIDNITALSYPAIDTGEGILRKVGRHKRAMIALGAAAAVAAGAATVQEAPKHRNEHSTVIDFSKYRKESVKVEPNQNPYDIIDEVETGLTPEQKLQLAKNIASQGTVLESDGVTHELGRDDVVKVAIIGEPRS